MKDDEYTESGTTVRRQFDFQGTDPSMAVIQTMADVTEQAPTELETLFDHIDPDSLNTLLLSSDNAGFEQATTVTFSVEDRTVSVASDGFVVVTHPDTVESE
jgi:hypothetical protein